ncbi:hypothetical protein NKH53_29035 [Mesorhizobium australicum]|uniref:hypothetical protein n=1 Tax=Mesorhizobium australicum TaxID=536018 RepID=UPI00333D56A5
MSADETKKAKLENLISSVPKHEFEFLMKLGKLSRQEVQALVEKHNGDRARIYADLAAKGTFRW